MFIDAVTIKVKAGNGGNGAVHFRRDATTRKGGPDGGTGGNGGSIYFSGSTNVNDLREFSYKKSIIAEDGESGKGKNLFGKNAPHIYIQFPIGTEITDIDSGRKIEITVPDKQIRIVKGGKGGKGNSEFATPTDRAPKYAEKGEIGESRNLQIELKLIAEIGLVGLPNAGKSSILSVLTNARPKIGAYPFTTIEPIIGMLQHHMIADIPGLISGASLGKGLGIRFLRHIEKTKIIVHCIDIQHENPMEAYQTVRDEFAAYNVALIEKPEIILLNKVDLVSKEKVDQVERLFSKLDKTVLICSVYDEVLIEKVKSTLVQRLTS